MGTLASAKHQEFLEQRAAQQEDARIEQYHSAVTKAVNSIDIDKTNLTGIRNANQVSFAVGQVFDGNGYQNISVSFDLLHRNSEPKIIQGPGGFKGEELPIETPKGLVALQHRLEEENHLGAKLQRSLIESVASGKGLDAFQGGHYNKETDGIKFYLNKKDTVTRADGSEMPVKVTLEIKADKSGTPSRFNLQVYKDSGPTRDRSLAGSSGFSGPFPGFTFTDKQTEAAVKQVIRDKIPPQKKR